MKWRNTLISTLLAGVLGLSLVPSASADPPPWAGKYKHQEEHRWNANKHWDHDGDHWRHGRDRDHDDWNRRYGRYDRDDWQRYDRGDWRRYDRDDWRRYSGRWDRDYQYGRYDEPYYSGRYTGACAAAQNRIYSDRNNIDRIGPTGRHRKALRWYQEDMVKARRDLARCG